jgi:hypothetical protein
MLEMLLCKDISSQDEIPHDAIAVKEAA